MSTVIPVAPRSRRGVELVLLLLAIGIVLLAYAAVGMAMQDEVPPDLIYYGAGLLVAVRRACTSSCGSRRSTPTRCCCPRRPCSTASGLVMIHRLDLAHPGTRTGTDAYAFRQLIWSAIGVLGAIAVIWVVKDHRMLRRFTYTAMVVGLGLLLLPLVPGLGRTINGSRIWIVVGPFSFQPGEIAKIVLAIFFAGYLVTHRDVLSLVGRRFLGIALPRARDLGPIIVAWLASLGVLVFEHDLGSSLLFFGLFVAMLYVATERRSWIVIGLVLFCAGAYSAYLDVRARAGPGRDLAARLRPVGAQQAVRRQLPGGPGALRHGGRRDVRHRARAGPPAADPASPRATSSCPRSVRSSAWSASSPCC